MGMEYTKIFVMAMIFTFISTSIIGTSFSEKHITNCTTINSSGLYVLDNDLFFHNVNGQTTKCITVENTSLVVIDAKGHNIYTDYSGQNTIGNSIAFYLDNVSNIVIKDVKNTGTVRKMFEIKNSNKILIDNVDVLDDQYVTPDYLYMYNVVNAKITNSIINVTPSLQNRGFGGNYISLSNSENISVDNFTINFPRSDKQTEPGNIIVTNSKNVKFHDFNYLSNADPICLSLPAVTKIMFERSDILINNSFLGNKGNIAVSDSNLTLINSNLNLTLWASNYNYTIPYSCFCGGQTKTSTYYNISMYKTYVKNINVDTKNNYGHEHEGYINAIDSHIDNLKFGKYVTDVSGYIHDSYIGDINFIHISSITKSLFDLSNSWDMDNITTKYGKLKVFTGGSNGPFPLPIHPPDLYDNITYNGFAVVYEDNVTESNITGKLLAYNSTIHGVDERPILLMCNNSNINAHGTDTIIVMSNNTNVSNTNNSTIYYSNNINIEGGKNSKLSQVNNVTLSNMNGEIYFDTDKYNIYSPRISHNVLIKNSNVYVNGTSYSQYTNSSVYNLDACNSTFQINGYYKKNGVFNTNDLNLKYPQKCCGLGMIFMLPYYSHYIEDDNDVNVLALYRNSTIGLYIDNNFIKNITTPYNITASDLESGLHNITVKNNECISSGIFYVAKPNHTLIFNEKVATENPFFPNKDGIYDVVNNITTHYSDYEDGIPAKVWFEDLNNLTINFLNGSKINPYNDGLSTNDYIRDKCGVSTDYGWQDIPSTEMAIINVSNVVVNNPSQTKYGGFSSHTALGYRQHYVAFTYYGSGNVTVNGGKADILIYKCNGDYPNTVKVNNLHGGILADAHYVYLNNVSGSVNNPYGELHISNSNNIYLHVFFYNHYSNPKMIYGNNIGTITVSDTLGGEHYYSNNTKDIILYATQDHRYVSMYVYGTVDRIDINSTKFFTHIPNWKGIIHLNGVKIGNANVSGKLTNVIIYKTKLPNYDTGKFGYAKMWVGLKVPYIKNLEMVGGHNANICFNYDATGRNVSVKEYENGTWKDINFTIDNNGRPCISITPDSTYVLFDKTSNIHEGGEKQVQLPPQPPKKDYTLWIMFGIFLITVILLFGRKKKR